MADYSQFYSSKVPELGFKPVSALPNYIQIPEYTETICSVYTGREATVDGHTVLKTNCTADVIVLL
jgi:hypothetical protein